MMKNTTTHDKKMQPPFMHTALMIALELHYITVPLKSSKLVSSFLSFTAHSLITALTPVVISITMFKPHGTENQESAFT